MRNDLVNIINPIAIIDRPESRYQSRKKMFVGLSVIPKNTFFICNIIHVLLGDLIDIAAKFYLAKIDTLVASVNQ